MSYTVLWDELPKHVRHNVWEACTSAINNYITLDDFKEELSKFNAKLIQTKTSLKALEFESEACYTMFLMRWS